MKTLFDPAVCDETIKRIETLSPAAQRQWGKMSHAQMLEHTARAVEMALGRGKQRQVFIGKLIGWMVKPSFVGEKPFGRNGPTGPDFIIKHEPEFEPTKQKLVGLVRELHAMGENGCDGHIHGFFGKMTGAEWGITQYKHIDHHLRQFGA